MVLVGQSHPHLFYLFQGVDVWLIDDPSTLHRFPQVVGAVEAASVLHVVPLEKDYDFVWVVGAASESPSHGAALLPDGRVFVEDRLPPLVILYLMTNEHVRHDVWLSSFLTRFSRSGSQPIPPQA